MFPHRACHPEKPYGKGTCSKEQCSAISSRQDTTSISSRRSELKQDVPLRCGRLFLIPKTAYSGYRIMTLVAAGMGSYTKEVTAEVERDVCEEFSR